MADGDEAAKGQAPGAGPRLPATGTGILTFGFGLAAGVLVAFTGLGFLDDSATVILVAFLVTLLVVAILGALAVALRRPILRRVFGFAETQIELFAGPLARTAPRPPRANWCNCRWRAMRGCRRGAGSWSRSPR
jgi:hypothetical protein